MEFNEPHSCLLFHLWNIIAKCFILNPVSIIDESLVQLAIKFTTCK